MYLPYTFTNENPAAIVAGMQPGPEDTVLAIAGSGDQAFALLEHGARVTATDAKDAQLAVVRDREAMIDRGEFASFLDVHPPDEYSTPDLHRCWQQRQRYFQSPGRLSRIRANLDHLTILPEALFIEFAITPGFTQAFLSNIFAYSGTGGGGQRDFDLLAARFEPGTVVYVSGDPTPLQSRHLRVDAERSRGAQKLEPLWTPWVYRRV